MTAYPSRAAGASACPVRDAVPPGERLAPLGRAAPPAPGRLCNSGGPEAGGVSGATAPLPPCRRFRRLYRGSGAVGDTPNPGKRRNDGLLRRYSPIECDACSLLRRSAPPSRISANPAFRPVSSPAERRAALTRGRERGRGIPALPRLHPRPRSRGLSCPVWLAVRAAGLEPLCLPAPETAFRAFGRKGALWSGVQKCPTPSRANRRCSQLFWQFARYAGPFEASPSICRFCAGNRDASGAIPPPRGR